MRTICGPDPMALADAVTARLEPGRRPVVLLDGGSGAGKTTLAHQLAELLGGWRVVSLDDCYPGWHGLAAGTAAVPGMLSGAHPGYRRWDWEHSRPADWVDLPSGQPLIIEGCGAISADTVPGVTAAVWCELDEPRRRARATARDGDSTQWWWPIWAAQEEVHWARHGPQLLADLVVEVGCEPG